MGFLRTCKRAALPALFLWLAAPAPGVRAASITVDTGQTFQTIVGWEATAEAGQFECSSFESYAPELFDRAVNQLGINRLRLEVRSGTENDHDYWADYRAGVIDKATWRSVRYATVNDNADPNVIDWNGFQFSALDQAVESAVLPIKQRLEALGRALFLNVTYVAFTNDIGTGLSYIHDDPDEYAEFVLATYLHLQSQYGLVPDTWEVILEPDNVPQWSGTAIGQAIVAAAARLTQAGFPAQFVAPSTTNMGNALSYFDAIVAVPGAATYLAELSYHRYAGVSVANLEAIAQRAVTYGVRTAMLEHIGSGYDDLHDDLEIAGNSAWQQFTLAFCLPADDGSAYYLIGTGAPTVTEADRTRFLRQYFHYVRAGAVRLAASTSDGTFSPLAFANSDGGTVVVIKANAGGTVTVAGLPAGTYTSTYTTAAATAVHGPQVVVPNGGTMDAAIPAAGVLTIHPPEAAGSTTTTTLPPPGDLLAEGRMFVLKNPKDTDPSRRRLVLRVDSGGPAQLGGDPTVAGAALNVMVGASAECYEMPAAGWSIAGSRGYRYRRPAIGGTPVKRALIRRSRNGRIKLKVTADGKTAPITLLPPGTTATAHATFEIAGGGQACATFGGTLVRSDGRLFKAKNAPAPASCALAGCAGP
ncbi:MAG: hypothetical protein D6815_01495 [Candidatus Dadabacteria bacterium]|nr:MAG: hypothetical protein D6815_01495 [Candidatus Dadabacteria bacterium]